MPRLTLGDLAQSTMLKLNQARLKNEVMRLGEELSTGERSSLHPSLNGDLAPLAALEASRASLEPWQGAATEAATAAEATQSALATLAELAKGMAETALSVADIGTQEDIDRFADEAREEFVQMVSTLNTSAAGRSLFGGMVTDTAPLVSGEQILSEIAASAAGAVTASDYVAAIDAYFAAGGGFDSSAYQGGSAPQGVRVSPSTTVDAFPTAGDDAIRETLRAAAIAALAGDGSLPLTATDRQALVETASQALFGADAALVDLQARVGHSQQRIETAQSALAAEAVALDQGVSRTQGR